MRGGSTECCDLIMVGTNYVIYRMVNGELQGGH